MASGSTRVQCTAFVAGASRELKPVRQEYDRSVAQVLQTGDLEAKKRLASVIDQIYEAAGELPPRINENRRRLANQISKAEDGST